MGSLFNTPAPPRHAPPPVDAETPREEAQQQADEKRRIRQARSSYLQSTASSPYRTGSQINTGTKS